MDLISRDDVFIVLGRLTTKSNCKTIQKIADEIHKIPSVQLGVLDLIESNSKDFSEDEYNAMQNNGTYYCNMLYD